MTEREKFLEEELERVRADYRSDDRNFKLMRNAIYSSIAIFGVYFGILIYLIATATR